MYKELHKYYMRSKYHEHVHHKKTNSLFYSEGFELNFSLG